MNIKNQTGGTHLLLILVIGVTAVAIFLSLSRSGIFGVSGVFDETRALKIRTHLFGCLDEVLLNLQDDNNYNVSSIDIGLVTCDVNITTPNPGEKIVYVELTDYGITRGVEVNLNVQPHELTHTMTKEIIN